MKRELQWFNEAIKSGIRIYNEGESEYLFYKGFKITKIGINCTIQDVRMNDFYETVSDKDMKVFEHLGFVKGADSLSHIRSKKRVENYIKKLENLYLERQKCIDNMSSNKPFYTKKLRNCQESIGRFVDLMFFYKAKITQYELKINLKNE